MERGPSYSENGSDIFTRQANVDINGNDFASEAISEFKNFPNPFSDETTIEFFSKNDEKVTVEIFDLLGKKVNTILDKNVVGKQSLVWDGRDASGARLSTGLYFIRLQSKGSSKISKVVLK